MVAASQPWVIIYRYPRIVETFTVTETDVMLDEIKYRWRIMGNLKRDYVRDCRRLGVRAKRNSFCIEVG